MKTLSSRERRLVALGLALAVVVLVADGVVWPLIDGFVGRAAEREQLQNEFRRNSRIIESAATWRDQAGRQAQSAGQFALLGDDRATAVEALASQLRDIATDVGGVVHAIAERDAGAPDRIGVTADAEFTMPQVYSCLSRLAHEGPYVLVESFAVTAGPPAAGGPVRLAVRLEVSAPVVLRPGPGAPAGPRPVAPGGG